MTCTNPKQSYYSKYTKPNGKRDLIFSLSHDAGDSVLIPCGKCDSCCLAQASEMTTRAYHEYEDKNKIGMFITLTYNPDNIPPGNSLKKEDYKNFIKKLKSDLDYKNAKQQTTIKGSDIRILGCGEYGEETSRPHYHILLFGYVFPDLSWWRVTDKGNNIYRSETLEKLWPLGHSEVGEVSLKSIGYVCRYTLKKAGRCCPSKTDELTGILKEKEFVHYPKNPGMGATHFERFHEDWYNIGNCIIDNTIKKIPRYYDRLLEKLNPKKYASVKTQRMEYLIALNKREVEQNFSESSPERCKGRAADMAVRLNKLNKPI